MNTQSLLRCSSSRGFALVLGALLALHAPAAWANAWDCNSGANGICTSFGGSTCSIDSVKAVLDGDTVDCSGLDVSIGIQGGIKVSDGFFTLKANDLTASFDSGSSGKLVAVQTGGNSPGGFDVELSGDLDLLGTFRANGPNGGGTIHVDADGDITVFSTGTDGIEANGTTGDADGGEIEITAGGNITLYDPIQVSGDGGGDASGGSIRITAAGDIVTGTDGKIQAIGHNVEGGQITLIARGNSALHPTADGDITIGAVIEAYAKGSDGNGGEVVITAEDAVTVSRPISVRGGVNVNGGDAFGGSVSINGGCGGVVINADIDGRGGQGGGLAGASLEVSAEGNITLKTGRKIWSEATQAGGVGGDVTLSSASDIILESSAQIDANGDTQNYGGEGASVELLGCNVSIADGVAIDVTGYDGGTIVVAAANDPSDAPLASGTQPLFVDEVASLSVAGNATDGYDGEIELIVDEHRVGVCEGSNPPQACIADSDCVTGCGPVPCIDNNPDTEGVTTQFDVTHDSISNGSLVACLQQCP